MKESLDSTEKQQNELIRESIENGDYFKDAMEWYSLSYISPITERAFFVLLSILSVFITYMFITIISSALPLKETVPVVIKEKDTAVYRTTIKSIKHKDEAKTTDEAVLRFLLINYIKEREEHNYKRAKIQDVNEKLDKIKNNSSVEVFEQFKDFMSRSNPSSPIHFFNKNVERKITINSFKFAKTKKITLFDKMKGFLAMQALPTKAYINYTSHTILPNKIIKEQREAEITFKFNGIDIDKKTQKFSPLRFIVIDYKKFKS